MKLIKQIASKIAKLTKVLRFTSLNYKNLARNLRSSSTRYSLNKDWNMLSADFGIALKKYEDRLDDKRRKKQVQQTTS